MNRSIGHHLGRTATAFVTVATVAWFLFALVVIVLRYVVFPHVADYREDFERIASRASGETVRIGSIDASWHGLRPSLALRELQVVDAQGGDVLELPSVNATLSWDSLLVMQVRLALLEIDAPDLTIRRDVEGQLFVAGFPLRRKASPDSRFAEWLLAQHEVRIRKARIVWHDEMKTDDAPTDAPASVVRDDLVLSDVDFALVRSGWRHRAALRATPPSALGAPLDVRAVIDHPLFASSFADPAAWRGEIYANVGTADVVAWRTWLPLPSTVDAGHGRARVWLRFTDATDMAGTFAQRLAERTGRPLPAALDRIAGITADLALDDVAVRWGATGHAALAAIDGRVDASQTPTAQQFTATRMTLQPLDTARLPPTDFRFKRTLGKKLADETGTATLGEIDIGASLGLVPTAVVPPAVAQKVAALKPRGTLVAMTMRWRGPIAAPDTFQIDAKFAHLALASQPPTPEAIALASREIVGPNGVVRKPHPAFGQQGFENVDGSLTARRVAAATAGQPPTTTVALKVAATDALVTAPGLFDEPTLKLAKLQADVGVKIVGTDVEVKVAHAMLENPDLAITADLVFRHGPHSGGSGENGGRGWIDLDARLSRADVGRVPRYLPTLIGPKARAYLKKSLLSGKVTEASFRMYGALDRLDLHVQPGALATANPVSVPKALVAIRDGKTASETPKAASDSDTIFHALVKVKGATFLYGPARDPNDPTLVAASGPPAQPSIAWPVFEDLDADIVFDQAKMTVIGHSTRVYGFRLTDVKAELLALADPAHVLRVVGKGTGPLQGLVRFINNSPVSRWTKGFTTTTQGSGDATLALALDLPLSHPRDAEVAGSLGFVNDELTLNATIPPLSHINGRADFTDRGLTIDGLTAQALGGTVRVDATTHNDGYIELGIDGALDVAAVKASAHDGDVNGFASPMSAAIDHASRFVSGGTRYKVGVRMRSKRVADLANDGTATSIQKAEDAGRPDLLIESDLVGLAIALPAPLAKSAAENWPLRIAITRTADASAVVEREDIRVTLADVLDADIARQRNPQGQLAVVRAGYVVGSDRTAADEPSSVRVSLPKLDLDQWRDVVKQIAAAPRPTTEPVQATSGIDKLLPEHATLKTPLLHAAGRDFTNVSIDAQRLASGWQGDVAADQVAGRLSYTDVTGTAQARSGLAPVSSGRLVARLSRLTIPQAEAGSAHVDSALDATKQKDFPAIDVVVDRFELRGRPLGRLEVVAENVGEGGDRAWQLEKLGLVMPEARFSAKGRWGHAGSVEHTQLDFDIEASDVGALMDRFGLTRTIKSGTATLSGDASWQGGPSTIDFGTLRGHLKLAADKGQFLKADPGIAKLLNILSLQGLARRLTLDFNDVFEAGFAFDTVRADATVDKGIATTDDFTMRGVQATVTMSGSADLARETTRLHVRVAPDINAGAASLGVAVVNPVLGLATFAAQYLFKDRISDALSFEYNVVGPWSKPEVTKIDHNGKETPVAP
ncbi:MAG: AsmA-like C-terminal region-containing protein, partial [Burkholderiaceae bacterium]